MANPKRGELTIALGKKKYKAKVTLDVVMRIEQSVGKGVVKIVQALSEGELTTSQMVAILTPAIRGGGNDVTEKDIGEDLWAAGLSDGMKAVGEIASTILGAGGDEGNDEEAAALL